MDINMKKLDVHITASPYDEELFIVCPICHMHDVGNIDGEVCDLGEIAHCDNGHEFKVLDKHLMTANEIYDEYGRVL